MRVLLRLAALGLGLSLAGAAWASLRERDYPRLRGRSLALAAGLSLVLAACLVPSFRRNLGHPAFGFADSGDHPADEAPQP